MRSRGVWGVHPRRSRGSCGATPRRGATTWSTGPRWPSGTPSGGHSGQRRRSWWPTTACASTSRTGRPGPSFAPSTVGASRDRRCRRGRAGTSPAVRTAAGQRPGVRSRYYGGSRWTSPRMSPCASHTRRSTRPFTSRDAACSSASWSPACAPDGHYVSRGSAPGNVSAGMSPPTC